MTPFHIDRGMPNHLAGRFPFLRAALPRES
jgi:hypothetical protein